MVYNISGANCLAIIESMCQPYCISVRFIVLKNTAEFLYVLIYYLFVKIAIYIGDCFRFHVTKWNDKRRKWPEHVWSISFIRYNFKCNKFSVT